MSDDSTSDDCKDIVTGTSLAAGALAGLGFRNVQTAAAVQQLGEAYGHYMCDHPYAADHSTNAYVLGKIGYDPVEGTPPNFAAPDSHESPVGPGLAEPLLADHELPPNHPDVLALGDLTAAPTLDTPIFDGARGPAVYDGWSGGAPSPFGLPGPAADPWHAGFGFAPDVHALGTDDWPSFDKVELDPTTITHGGGIHVDVSGLTTDHWLAVSPSLSEAPHGPYPDLASPPPVPDPWGPAATDAFGHGSPSWASDHAWTAPAWHNDAFGSAHGAPDFGHAALGSTSLPHTADLGAHTVHSEAAVAASSTSDDD